MCDRRFHVRLLMRRDYINADWTHYRVLDHGVLHPTCCAWVAVHKNGDRYFYRQYYRVGLGIPVCSKQIIDATGADEYIQATIADPSIWRRDVVDAQKTWAQIYELSGLPLVKADNSAAGYEAVTEGLMSSMARWALGRGEMEPLREVLGAPSLEIGDVQVLADRPAIWFHPSCADGEFSLFEQVRNLRYKKQVGDPQHKAPSELVEDVDDEGPDVVRYAMQTEGVMWTVPRPRTKADLVARLFEQSAARKEEESVY